MGSLGRTLRLAVILVALALAGFSVASLFFEDQPDLPILYDGFD
jgi:hypothetical protein